MYGPTAPYLINLMRPVWERAGWIVTDVVGVSRKIPADAAILHVDLSLVPDEYREFVESYPVAINGKILDIRKNSTSRNRVLRGDAYDGPVIVKTVLNSAGLPEIKLQFQHRSPFGLAARFLARKGICWPGGVQPHYPHPMRGKHDYLIFDSARDLPEDIFDCPDLIVEKFQPEIYDGQICLREWYFFGDVSIDNLAELSADPVSTFGEQAPQLHRPVPPELWDLRCSLGLDYGKIDYPRHLRRQTRRLRHQQDSWDATPADRGRQGPRRVAGGGLELFVKRSDAITPADQVRRIVQPDA